MKSHRRRLCLLGIIVLHVAFTGFTGVIFAQRIPHHKISTYKTKDGLSANATKALVQDINNVLWIGSDEGLSRFDGTHFRNFRNSLPSQYVKYLYKTRDNRILIAHDLGISEIRETLDTVSFPMILRGERAETDSTVNYPKQLYEDADGTLWIAESRSLLRLRNGSIKRYPFDVRCQTNSFLRSFSFAPDGFGSFVVSSQTGYCFWYNRTQDVFVEIILPNGGKPLAGTSDMLNFAPGVVWVGYAGGVCELRLDSTGHLLSAATRLLPPSVSALHRTDDGVLYIGTWFSGVFIVEPSALESALRTVTQTPINAALRQCASPFATINLLRSNPNGDLWLSSDEGIAVLKRSPITTVDFGHTARSYIQAIALDSAGAVYTSNGMALYSLRQQADCTVGGKQIFTVAGTDILSLACTKNFLWCGTTDGKLYRASTSKIASKITSKIAANQASSLPFENIPTIRSSGRNPTLFYLFADSRSAVWACGELESGALCVRERQPDPQGASTQANSQVSSQVNVELYDAKRGLPSVIRCFKESPAGVLYCAGRSRDKQQYLFRYSTANDRFEDLSKRLPTDAGTAFEVNDLCVRRDDDIWLCSSVGLFRQTASGVVKVPIFYAPTGEEIINFKAITSDDTGALWIGTSHGLVIYHENGEYFFLNENGGLPASEIAFRAMLWAGKQSGMWVGTVKGLVNIRSLASVPPNTPTPLLTSVVVNGQKQAVGSLIQQDSNAIQSIVYPHSSDIQLGFLSVVFGEDIVSYQYRLLGNGRDSTWSTPQQEPSATFLTLPTGEYRLEIRAMQSGAYRWSKPLALHFRIARAWHEYWWSWVGIVAIAAGIIWFAVSMNARRLEQQKRDLEHLIDERTREVSEKTAELHNQNQQLLELNREKNEFLGIVAHDLKNPISGIRAMAELLIDNDATIDTPTRQQVLTTIVGSTERMVKLVANLLDINQIERGLNTPNLTMMDVSPIVAFVIEDHQNHAATKGIHLHLKITGETTAFADEQAVGQVFDNLVSNAIKYSPQGKQVFVRIVGNKTTLRVEIQDEGPGLSEQDMSKLFGKFARLSARPTGGEHSTGLGLSIVKKMVEAMNGCVWCESVLGEGATFIVELPVTRQQ